MHISLSLVGLTLLAMQCRSQSVENDRQSLAVATQYQQIDQENLRQERQLKQLSRQDRRIPNDYRYQYDSEQNVPAETQYQPSYSGPSNRIIGRPQQIRQPAVEQYLKEVTPTTKTTYDPRTYQAEGSNQAQTAEEYFLHPEAQKRPYIQHPQYELSESPKETPVPQNVLAYQNALLAQQNAIYEQQRADQLQKQQDNAQKSSFYAPQSVQKKPATIGKLVKPKPSSLDEELEYLTRLQYQQQQIQQQNKAYENKQPPLVSKYQARIPQFSKPELLATEEEQAQSYQPQVQYTLTRFAKPSKAPKFQIYQPEYKTLAQSGPSNFDQFDHTQYEQPQLIQYQPQPQHQELSQAQQYSAGAKHLPEQKLFRYQQPIEEKYTQQIELPRDEALQRYRASIAKYHATGSGKTEPRPQIRPQNSQHEQPQKFQAQQYEQPAAHQQPQQPQQPKPPQEIYQGPTDEEYRQSEFKQSLGLNSSLRVLKSGKPVVFVGHEE